jgi:hypothetical protein
MSEQPMTTITGFKRTTTINGQSCTHHTNIRPGWQEQFPHPKDWEGQSVTCPVCQQMIGYHYRNVYYGCLPDGTLFHQGISIWEILRDAYLGDAYQVKPRTK